MFSGRRSRCTIPSACAAATPLARLADDAHRPLDGELAASVAEEAPEILALDALEQQPSPPGLLARVEEAHHVDVPR
jgi:hypothetical protein